MKKIVILVLLLSYQVVNGQEHCSTGINTPLGSTNNEYDWRQDSYTIYRAGSCGEEEIPSPFRGDVPNYNIEHLYFVTDGVYDYEPNDGWELMYKWFGTSTSPLPGPAYLILYNRYESNLRIFCYVNASEDYNQAMLNLKFDWERNPLGEYESGLLAHIEHPEVALENFRKTLVASAPNEMVNGSGGNPCDSYWLFADIPVAYDPCTCNYFSELDVVPKLSDYQSISLNIEGGGTITEVLSGLNSHTSVLSNVNGAVSQGAKTAKTLQGFYNIVESVASTFDLIDFGSEFIGSYQDNVDIVNNGVSSLAAKDAAQAVLDRIDKRAKESFSFPKWAKDIPKIGVVIGVLDFMIGGGKSTARPKPTSFEADLSFVATRELNRENQYTNAEVYTPGSDWGVINPSLERKEPVYDNILGIFTLLETPKVIETDDGGYIENQIGEYVWTVDTRKIQLAEDIKYAVNPASGLVIDDIGLRYVITNTDYLDLGSSSPLQVIKNENLGFKDYLYLSPIVPSGCLSEYVLSLKALHELSLFQSPEVLLEVNVTLKQNPDLTINPLYDPNADKVFIRHRYLAEKVEGEITEVNNLGMIKSHEEIDNLNMTEDMVIYAWSTVEIVGPIVTNGHNLTVIAGYEITGNISDLPDGVDLIIGNPAGCGEDVPQQTSDDINTFCTSSLYDPIVARPGIQEPDVSNDTTESKSFIGVHPNPFQDYFKISYQLGEEKEVLGFLRNALGQVVREIRLEGGAPIKELIVDSGNLPTGIYFLTIQTESDIKTVKLMKQVE